MEKNELKPNKRTETSERIQQKPTIQKKTKEGKTEKTKEGKKKRKSKCTRALNIIFK